MRVSSIAIVLALTILCGVLTAPAFAEVTFEWATVGSAGNAEDPTNSPGGSCELYPCISGIGSVDYDYRIAKHEVTNAQYAEFLGAVAATDTNALFNALMESDSRGGIIQSGTSGSFTYNVKDNMVDKPVIYVSFLDAMRLVNWLHNGQPAGAQDASTTEDGAYAISDGITETRTVGAQFFIPTENEWYKAAYHQPAADGGDADEYWLFPTASNSVPTVATANATGDISNPGMNVENYSFGADWNGLDGNVTTVGSAGPLSESYYGTSDQGGNVTEWNETLYFSIRIHRGGAWNTFDDVPRSYFRQWIHPTFEDQRLGFRVAGPAVAPIPTLSEWGLAVLIGALLIAGTCILRRPKAA